MEIENAIAIGYQAQFSLLQSMRMMSDESGAVVRNELENALRCTEMSLASLEDVVGRQGYIKEAIACCDGYLAAVRKAKCLSAPYLSDIEAGDIGDAIDYVEEALCSLKGIVDGYKSM